jgi:hypothetical protein
MSEKKINKEEEKCRRNERGCGMWNQDGDALDDALAYSLDIIEYLIRRRVSMGRMES